MLTAKTRVAPNKTLCPTFRILCSTSWSTIVSSSERSQIGVCHQLSPSNLRSARIAFYSIIQQLFLPEFRYIKESTTPEDSTSNLPIELSSKRIKKNSHLLSLSPFFDGDNNVMPAEQIVESFAFQFTGMDYCVPFYTKGSSQKLQKSYTAIFICFTTKAIHLEPVENLTREDCLDTLKRFTARRGTPQAFYSDSSTTFIGVRGELEFRRLLRDEEFKDLINNFASQNHIDWFTIPHRTPHFGELWEVAVKSMKRHLLQNGWMD